MPGPGRLRAGRVEALSDIAAPGDRPIRLLVVDDHEVFATSLAVAIAREPGIEVVAAVTTEAAARVAIGGGVDVVLLDFRLGDRDGTVVSRALLDEFPNVAIVMLTATADETVLVRALDAGCVGFVTKTEPLAVTVDAVKRAAAGESVVTPALLARLLSRTRRGRAHSRETLTPREMDILALVVAGLTNQEIADRLFLSRDTVRNHVASILSKLGAHSKLEAAAVAVRSGLIAPPS